MKIIKEERGVTVTGEEIVPHFWEIVVIAATSAMLAVLVVIAIYYV